jgi:hypothetical protein
VSVLQVSGVTADSTGWVSTVVGSITDITLGSQGGKGMAGAVQGLWVLPAAVAFDSLATAGQSVPNVLAAITAPANPAAASGPSVALQVLTAAAVVGSPVSVAVSAAAAAGSTVRARVTFYGAAPR